MTVRNIKKNLAGAEDLLHGIGVETQARGGSLYDMHKLDTYVPTYDVEEMKRSSLTFMRLYGTDTAYTDYRRNPTGTVGIPSDLGGIWEPIRSSELPVCGSFIHGAYVFSSDCIVGYNDSFMQWQGYTPKVVAAGATPATSGGIGAGTWVDRTDVTLRSELLGADIDSLIGGIYRKALVIPASKYITSGVDCASVIQTLQDLSELYRIPIDFSGIETIAFSGKITIGDFFHWKSSGRFDSTITPLTKSRATLGANVHGVYAWFTPLDPTVSITHAILEDIGFDGGYVGPYNTPLDSLVRAFCWHAHGSAVHSDITAIRVHFKDCPHEAWEGYTTSGGKIDGIRQLFCSASVTDPLTSAVGFNVFKTMNGDIDSPGPYGTYTIKNVVSFGCVASGMRTLNDFKRGTENWTISASETHDMNDCHHSTDGSRNGLFDASNKGYQTGAARANNNYLEIQGKDIDVAGGQFDADRNATSTKRCIAAVFVTDYEYPAYGGDTAGNKRRQSVNVNVRAFSAKNINHHAIRFINVSDCSIGDILADNCLLNGAAVEYLSGYVDTDSNLDITCNAIVSGIIKTKGCEGEISIASGAKCAILVKPVNEANGHRVSFVSKDDYVVNYAQKIINKEQTSFKNLDYLSGSATKTDYAGSLPIGLSYAFTLEDTNTSSVQSLKYSQKIPLSQSAKEFLYVRLYCLAGTAAQASILIQEYDASGVFIASTFKNLSPTASFTERVVSHLPSTASVAYCIVGLVPAASSGASLDNVGTTTFGDIRISKDLL